jgi:hypothetical protein
LKPPLQAMLSTFFGHEMCRGGVLSFLLIEKKEPKKRSRLWENVWKLHRGAKTNEIRRRQTMAEKTHICL